MKILWINRIIALVIYCLYLWICEHFKLTPIVCFLFATFCLIGMSFIIEVVNAGMK